MPEVMSAGWKTNPSGVPRPVVDADLSSVPI